MQLALPHAQTPQKKLGMKIRLARISCELTQKKLGELINCSQDVVSRCERGETIPDALMLQAIARSLGQSMEYFQV